MAGWDTELIGLGVGLDRETLGWGEVHILQEYERALVESKLQTNHISWDKGYLRKHLFWKKKKKKTPSVYHKFYLIIIAHKLLERLEGKKRWTKE